MKIFCFKQTWRNYYQIRCRYFLLLRLPYFVHVLNVALFSDNSFPLNLHRSVNMSYLLLFSRWKKNPIHTALFPPFFFLICTGWFYIIFLFLFFLRLFSFSPHSVSAGLGCLILRTQKKSKVNNKTHRVKATKQKKNKHTHTYIHSRTRTA